MVDIANRRVQASQSAFLNSLNLPAGTSMNVIVIFILHHISQEQLKLSDIVLFCLNPLKLNPFFSIFD